MHALILKNVGRFIQLSEQEKAFFLSLLQPPHLEKKQILVQAGEYTQHNYFVNRGCLRTFFMDATGLEHNVLFSIEDWWAGDMYSFLTEQPARYTVVAMETTELLAIEKKDLETLYREVPRFERYFRQLLQNAFIAFQERILSGLTDTAEERYLKFREKYPEVERRVPQQHIASYLGITPESLSRIRKSLVVHSKARKIIPLSKSSNL
ncbi:MAG: Crp/Fnr family transcriptional regulator [Chitinophagaceae bacterium]